MDDILQLEQVNPVDPIQPPALCGLDSDQVWGVINFIVSNFIIKVKGLEKKGFIFSNTTPDVKDRDKVWVRTQQPYLVGYFIDGQYQLDYLHGWPNNTPFLSNQNILNANIAGLRKLSASEIEKYGLTDTKEDATERMYWFIFTPEEISV